jgi:hypothetical protein
LIQINKAPVPANECIGGWKRFPAEPSFAEEGDQATSDGSAPNPKATEPDDVLIERTAHRNHQREE